MFDVENLGQGQSTPFAMAPCDGEYQIINVYKSHKWAFFANFHRFPDASISNFMTMKI